MGSEFETLRWPIRLNHRAIVLRLVQFREMAASSGRADLAATFEDVEHMPAVQIAVNVVETLTGLLDKPECRPLAKGLEMVAMNLKNLKRETRRGR
jgi:hypothetical protein